MDIYSLLSCWVFTISLPYFQAFRQASVCLIQQFCGLREDGGGVRGTTCCVYILFVCIHVGDTAAFTPKNSPFPLARPSSPPIFILIFAVSPPPLRATFLSSSSSCDPVITFPVHPSCSLYCKGATTVQLSRKISGLISWSAQAENRDLATFFPRLESLSIFHFCW